MYIEFGKMTAHNFLSYKELEFDWSSMTGMNLITGVNEDVENSGNGSGKSSMFHILFFSVYGKVPSGLPSANVRHMHLKPGEDDGVTYTTLDFKVDGKKYYVKQTITGKSNKPGCQLYRYNDDGTMEDISRGTCTETRNFITKEVVATPSEIFMRTIMLNADPTYNFYNLTDGDRVKFFERMFDLKYFADMADYIKKSVDNKFKKALATATARLMDAKRIADEYNEKDAEFESHKQNLIKEAQERYDAAKALYDKCNAEYKKIDENKLKKIDKCIENLETSEANLKERITNLATKIRIDNQSIIANDTIINDKTRIVNKGKNITSMLCDTCKHTISDHFKLGEFEHEIDEKIASNETLTTSVKTLEHELLELRKNLDDALSKHKKLKLAKDKAQEDSTNKINKLRSLERELGIAQSELNTAMNMTNNIQDLIERNNAEITARESTLADAQMDLNVAKYCLNIVSKSGIEGVAMAKMIKALNIEVSNNLRRLGSDYKVVMTDDMDYYFDNGSTTVHPKFKNFSSGEQSRISIATCLAFKTFLSNRSGFKSNITCIDEYIDGSVDSVAIRNIFGLMKDQATALGQSVFIISHRSEIKSEPFDNVIEIHRIDKSSVLKIV